MQSVNVYIAGKVSPNSVFGRHDWRDPFCAKLTDLSGVKCINLDPTKSDDEFDLDEANDRLIFGRDCFMIQLADFVIVNLTDDISVGGSQEMLIAKYYHKPLIGIAPKGGKFFKEERIIRGKPYKNWKHPFVSVPCDVLVEDINGAAECMKTFLQNPHISIKHLEDVLDASRDYYAAHHHKDDSFLHDIREG